MEKKMKSLSKLRQGLERFNSLESASFLPGIAGREIDGKDLANKILANLKKKVRQLKKKNRLPRLAVFSAGDDPASVSYINQKRTAARTIGVKLKQFNFQKETSYQVFAEKLNEVAKDRKFSGVIIQKPLPVSLSHKYIDSIIPLEKDVDGYQPKSLFLPPVAMAVLIVLDFIQQKGKSNFRSFRQLKKLTKQEPLSENLLNWLNHQSILLIGRGATAGIPIAETFSSKKIKFLIAHRGTANLPLFAKKADIIISCVGKKIIKKEMLKKGAVLIGVGIRRIKKGVYRGDFNQKEIKDLVSFYTPTPGGIGPLTVACLMNNLVAAASLQKKS